MSKSRTLGVVIVLQMLILAGQWLGNPSYLPPAQAQLTDPGRDRKEMLDQLSAINVKLDKLIGILERGELQVKVVQPDESKGR